MARLSWVDGELSRRESFLVGDDFTVADAYLFTVAGWLGYVGLDIAKWPALAAYRARIATRPAVRAAMQAEKAG